MNMENKTAWTKNAAGPPMDEINRLGNLGRLAIRISQGYVILLQAR